MEDKRKLVLMVIGVVVVVVAALIFMGKTATAPQETVNDFKAVPPKGAGKFDRS
jgi:hypothetical protein